MTWKTIPHHKVPRWVKRKRRVHVRGRNYLYRRHGKVWQSRLRSEWRPHIPWWKYILVGFLSTLLAALVSGILLWWFFDN